MEENVSSPTVLVDSEHIDEYIDLQTDIKNNLDSISDDLKFLRDYFEITEEEQNVIDSQNKKIEKEEELQLKEDKEYQEKLLSDLFTSFEDSATLSDLKSELVELNSKIDLNNEVSTVSSSTNYLFLSLLAGFCVLYIFYKLLRKFI